MKKLVTALCVLVFLEYMGDGVEVKTEDVRQQYIAYLKNTLAKYGD